MMDYVPILILVLEGNECSAGCFMLTRRKPGLSCFTDSHGAPYKNDYVRR